MAEIARFVRSNATNTAGGDGTTDTDSGASRAYLTVSEMEAAEQADFVTDTDNLLATVSGGVADTTNQTLFDGSTTDATYNIVVNFDYPGGVYDTSYYAFEPATQPSGGGGVQLADPFVILNGPQIQNTYTGNTGNRYAFYFADDSCEINNFIIKGTNTGTGSQGIVILPEPANGNKIQNGVVYDIPSYGVHISGPRYSTVNEVSFVVVSGASTGFQGNVSYKDLPIAKNCVAINCTTGWAGTWNSSSSNNASSDSTHPGTSGVALTNDVLTDYFVSATDFHIDNTATNASELLGAGVAVSGITTDWNGDTRDASTPDIGADEDVSGSITGALVSAGAGGATFGSTLNAGAALTASATASAVASSVMQAIAGISEGAEVSDTQSKALAVSGSVVAGGTGDAALDALAQASAALVAAAQSGEAWVSAISGSYTGALTANTSASQSFVAAAQMYGALTGATSISESITATLNALSSLTAAAQSGATFAGDLNNIAVAITDNVDAAVLMVAAANANAAFTAGAIAGATFAIAGTLGYLIGAITLQAALVATHSTQAALDGSISVEPKLSGNNTLN